MSQGPPRQPVAPTRTSRQPQSNVPQGPPRLAGPGSPSQPNLAPDPRSPPPNAIPSSGSVPAISVISSGGNPNTRAPVPVSPSQNTPATPNGVPAVKPKATNSSPSAKPVFVSNNSTEEAESFAVIDSHAPANSLISPLYITAVSLSASSPNDRAILKQKLCRDVFEKLTYLKDSDSELEVKISQLNEALKTKEMELRQYAAQNQQLQSERDQYRAETLELQTHLASEKTKYSEELRIKSRRLAEVEEQNKQLEEARAHIYEAYKRDVSQDRQQQPLGVPTHDANAPIQGLGNVKADAQDFEDQARVIDTLLQAENSEQKLQISSLKMEKDELKGQVARLNSELEKLQAQLEESNGRLQVTDALQKQCSTLLSEKERLDEEHYALRKQITHMQREHNQKLYSLTSMSASFMSVSSASMTRSAAYTEGFAGDSSRDSQLSSEMLDAETQTEASVDESLDSQSQSTSTKTVQEINARCAELERTKANEVRLRDEEIKRLRLKVSELEKRYADLDKDFKSHMQALQEQKRQNAALEHSLRQSEAAKKDHIAQIDNNKAQQETDRVMLAEKQKRIEELEASAKQNEDRIKKQMAFLDDKYKGKITKLEEESARAIKDYELSQKELEALKKHLQSFTIENEGLVKEIDKLTQERDEQENGKHDLEKEISTLKEQIEMIEIFKQQSEGFRVDFENEHAKFVKADMDAKNLQVEKTQLEERVQNMVTMLDHLQNLPPGAVANPNMPSGVGKASGPQAQGQGQARLPANQNPTQAQIFECPICKSREPDARSLAIHMEDSHAE